MADGDLKFEGTLEAKLLPHGEGALPNEPQKKYPNFYHPTRDNPKPRLGLWHRLKLWFHSWNLQRKIDKGIEPRGHTREPD